MLCLVAAKVSIPTQPGCSPATTPGAVGHAQGAGLWRSALRSLALPQAAFGQGEHTGISSTLKMSN